MFNLCLFALRGLAGRHALPPGPRRRGPDQPARPAGGPGDRGGDRPGLGRRRDRRGVAQGRRASTRVSSVRPSPRVWSPRSPTPAWACSSWSCWDPAGRRGPAGRGAGHRGALAYRGYASLGSQPRPAGVAVPVHPQGAGGGRHGRRVRGGAAAGARHARPPACRAPRPARARDGRSAGVRLSLHGENGRPGAASVVPVWLREAVAGPPSGGTGRTTTARGTPWPRRCTSTATVDAVLVVAERPHHLVPFSDEDLRLLESLANHTAVSAAEVTAAGPAARGGRPPGAPVAARRSHGPAQPSSRPRRADRRAAARWAHGGPRARRRRLHRHQRGLRAPTAATACSVRSGRRLEPFGRAPGHVARLGNDEFVVLLRDVGSVASAERAARPVLAALGDPFEPRRHDRRPPGGRRPGGGPRPRGRRRRPAPARRRRDVRRQARGHGRYGRGTR